MIIDRYKDLIFKYDAIWFPDDDLSANAKTINEMFDLFMRYDLKMAQPALTKDSYFTHGITLENNNFVLRYTDFVEVMAPIFLCETLREVWETFNQSQSGWGLDNIWPKKINAGKRDLAIIDQTAVKHTRPVGGGELYNKLNISPHQEVRKLLIEYQVLLKKFSVIDGIPRVDNKKGDISTLLLNGTPTELLSLNKFATEYLYPNLTRMMLESNQSESDIMSILKILNTNNVHEYFQTINNNHDIIIINAIEKYSSDIINDLNVIGSNFIANNQIERGILYLNNAFVLNEKHSETLYNLAKALLELKEYKQALNLLNQIQNKDQNVLDLIFRIQFNLKGS